MLRTTSGCTKTVAKARLLLQLFVLCFAYSRVCSILARAARNLKMEMSCAKDCRCVASQHRRKNMLSKVEV
jgi:hypothetical protein